VVDGGWLNENSDNFIGQTGASRPIRCDLRLAVQRCGCGKLVQRPTAGDAPRPPDQMGRRYLKSTNKRGVETSRNILKLGLMDA